MTKQAKRGKRYEFTGYVYTNCHRVSFRWELDGHELTQEMDQRLREEAEDRAHHMICEGCCSGDLCAIYVTPDKQELEFWGWWEIERD